MGMFSETTYSSQTKLIGEGLLIKEHGIGYSNLAFEENKGQKRPIFSFKPQAESTGFQNNLLTGNYFCALY